MADEEYPDGPWPPDDWFSRQKARYFARGLGSHGSEAIARKETGLSRYLQKHPEAAKGLSDAMMAVNFIIPSRTGKLPMDLASRLKRARDQGYRTDEQLYHGTHATFDRFDPSYWQRDEKAFFLSPNPEVANDFAGSPHYLEPRIIPAFTRGREWRITLDDLRDFSSRYEHYSPREPIDYDSRMFRHFINKGHDKGFDTVRFPLVRDYGPDADQIALLNPSAVRARSAAFDPEHWGSPNLLASGAGAATLGSMLWGRGEPEQ